MKPRRLFQSALPTTLITVACSVLAATLAQADQTWTGATSEFWTTSTNWTTTTPGSGDVAIFNASSTTNLTNRVSAPFSVLGLSVVDPAGAVTIAPTLSAAAITADNLTDILTYSVAPAVPLANGDIVTLGATTAPAGLTAGTRYFVVSATATTFQVSATLAGAPILFTANGTAVTVTGGPALTLGASGINMIDATQNLTIGVNTLVLNSAQAWNVTTGRTLTVSGTSTGSAVALTKSGAGILQLNAPQLAAAGSVLLTAGETRANAGNYVNLFNSAPVTFENGASLVHFNGSSTVTLLSNVVVASGQSGTINMGARIGWGNNTDPTETLTGAGTLNLIAATNAVNRDDISADMTAFTGTINFSGAGSVRLFINGGKVGAGFTNSTVDLAGTVNINPLTNSGGNLINVKTLTGTSATATLGGGSAGAPTYSVGASGTDTVFAGGISGNAALTKVGSGVLTLTNTTLLNYTGATNVNVGTLKINGAKTGVGATSVVSGGTLTGTGSVAGTTTIQSGGTLAPGDGGIGNLTCSNLALNTGSKLNLEFGAGNDKATVAAGSTLTLQSGINVDVNGFGTDGTFDIINVTGATVTGTAATAFTAINGDGSKIYAFANTGTAIQMTISSSDPNNFWKGGGPGSWATAANWTKDPTIPNAVSAIAKFGPGLGGAGGTFTSSFAVTLDGDKTVGLLSFADASGAVVTLDPGVSTPGTLNIDDGEVAGNIVVATGLHIINAPVAVDAQGVAVDIGTVSSLTINGVLSGSSAALTKIGTGDLFLTGDNSYGGGTVLGAGRININSATSLGVTSAAATFSGGTLQLGAPLAGITRSYLLTGTNSAVIDTNGFDYGYGGVIGPVNGATGGLAKNGTGIMTLTAAQTYTGTTAVSGGVLLLDAGGAITGGAVSTTITGGGLISTRNTGTLNATTGTFSPQTGGLFMDVDSGNVSFSGTLSAINTTNNGNSASLRVTSGTLSAPTVQLGRTGLSNAEEPLAAPGNTNLYLTGGAVNVSGNLIIGAYTGSTAPNSSVVTRVDGGTLTVGGAISIGLNNGGRWSMIDVNGGTVVNTGVGTDSGVVLGGPLVGKAAFLMRAGTATVERIQFGRGVVDGQGLLNISGGALYVGSEGISLGSTGIYTSEIRLSGGALGAKAAWASTLPVNLTAASTIKAADATDAPFDINLSGALTGTGSLTKSGAGVLTLNGVNNYTGSTTVTAGTLSLGTDDVLSDIAPVDVASGATLNLNHAGTDTVGAFQINGVDQGSGTFGGTGSEATHIVPEITGTGLLYVAPSSPYSAWSSDLANGLTAGVNDGATQDPDNDGVSNLLEFVLGGNPMVSSTGILPVLAVDANNFVFTFNRKDESESEVTLTFQHGSDLSAWTDVAIGAGAALPIVNVVENDASPDTVTVTIPKGINTKLFGRVQAVK